MTSKVRWLIAAVAVALITLLVVRLVQQRRDATAAAAAPVALPAVDLAAGDIAIVRRAELSARLPVSGGLRAVNSAILRAKVAAEVREVLVREGDRVERGQVLVRLDDTEFQWRLRQAEDQASAAKSQLDITERTLANNKALVDQGFISKTALDTAVSSASGAHATLQAARAAAELARKSVGDAVLRAPLAGLISQRLVQPGERVSIDAKLLEVVDLSTIELEAALAPEDVAGVRIGQTARLQVDGLPETVTGRVTRINPSAQTGSRAVMTYLALNPHPALRQGLFARGGIELERKSALVVPLSAVRLDQARPYVLVVEGGKVTQRTVSTGARGEAAFFPNDAGGTDVTSESAIEVSGVAAGATVLRGSVGAMHDGALVRLPPAAAAVLTAPAASAAPVAAAASR